MGVSGALIGMAVIAVMSLLLWLARRNGPRVDAEPDLLLVRHYIVFRGFAQLAAFGLPAALAVLLLFDPVKDTEEFQSVVALYVVVVALTAPLLWNTQRFALIVSADGLDCRSAWKRRRFISWAEIESIACHSKYKDCLWLVIRSKDGWKFRVFYTVSRLLDFLTRCELNLPPERLRGAKPLYMLCGRKFPEMKDDTV
jgi:hypothetical protein